MAQKRPVTPELDEMLSLIALSGKTPGLLLHCCCAPCTSSVLEYLSPYFNITLFYYNPNIMPREEYDKRANEFSRLPIPGYPNNVDLLIKTYEPEAFLAAARPLAGEPEGGLRCSGCFELRLTGTAEYAKQAGYDYFTTTLTVSPHKDADVINEAGGRLAGEYGVKYLKSDFKKRDGYKRSIELSKQYGLYRQQYCGCMLAL